MARGSTRAWRKLRAWVLARDGGICHLCERGGADSVDHVIPVAHGGTDEPGNLRAAHSRCNTRKGARVATQPRTSRAW